METRNPYVGTDCRIRTPRDCSAWRHAGLAGPMKWMRYRAGADVMEALHSGLTAGAGPRVSISLDWRLIHRPSSWDSTVIPPASRDAIDDGSAFTRAKEPYDSITSTPGATETISESGAWTRTAAGAPVGAADGVVKSEGTPDIKTNARANTPTRRTDFKLPPSSLVLDRIKSGGRQNVCRVGVT